MRNKCLVIGHNIHDIESANKHGMNRGFHQPAPTTLLHDDWSKFDGDIISCHIQVWGAKYVCSVDFSDRFSQSSGILVYGEPPRDVLIRTPKIFNFCQREDVITFPAGEFFTRKDSGFFALWFALTKGYDDVYTVGLDQVSLHFTGEEYDIERAKSFVRGEYVPGVVVKEYRKFRDYPRCIHQWTETLQNQFPKSTIYKASELSILPVEVMDPLNV